MKSFLLAALFICSCSLVPGSFAAEKKAEGTPVPPKTTVGVATDLIVATPFDQAGEKTRKGQIAGWQAGKGEYEPKADALHVSELEEDHHPSSLTYKIDATDLIITAQFKLGTAESISFGCRDTVPPNNHLARTFISAKSLAIQKMSGISTTTKSEKVKEQKATFDPNQWYPITIEIIGDRYTAHVGNETISATHDRFKDAKGIVALIVKGKGGAFKDVAVWHAKPKGGQPAKD